MAKSLVLAAAVAASLQPNQTVVIEYDGGGKIFEYAQRMRAYKDREINIEFRGKCMSACTIYLALSPEHLCVSDKASFSFHRASAADQYVLDWYNEWMMKTWPDWARQWIIDQGGLTTWFKTMPAEYALKYIKRCR